MAAPKKKPSTSAASTPKATTGGRKSIKNSKVGSKNVSATPPRATSFWEPPSGSWENDVLAIDTIESNKDGLQVYLHWEDGKKSKHAIETIYKKCPQKMLRFYEQHL